MWSDNETDLDLLGFQHLSSAVTSVVRNGALLPATLGVFGDWGSGKSSLLQMIRAELGKDDQTLVLNFNGWLFEGYEDVKAALTGTILDEIVERRTVTVKAKSLVLRLVKRINLLRVAGAAGRAAMAYAVAGPIGLGLSAGADIGTMTNELWEKAKKIDPSELKDFLKENDPGQNLRRSVREFREDFEELLRETNVKTLVVIIDDLDRCLPDTVIETLEAIKLFLFAKGTAFVIGADERLVQYAVRRRFPELPGERVDVGRDYLEKLIQYPVRIPSLGRTEMETYINILFAQKAKIAEKQFASIRDSVINCAPGTLLDVRFNNRVAQKILGEVPSDLADQLSLGERLAPILASGLAGNPRQAKRFLNALMMRLQMATSRSVELRQRVLAKLMLLEYFRPESFKQLAQLQSEELGRPALLQQTEDAALRNTSKSNGDGGVGGRKGQKNNGGNSLSESAALWLSDPWLLDWLQSEPSLVSEDLRPYFYFARDRLGALGGSIQRMSPQAQEFITELFSESEAVRLGALKKAKDLNAGDATAVFEVLADKARQEEDPGADGSAMKRLLDWTEARIELLSQLLTFFAGLADGHLFPGLVPRLRGLADASPQQKMQVRSLFDRWSKSSNGLLNSAAETALKATK